jgi:hypothetical protein
MMANGIAFRVAVNANSTGATAQRADCPPLFAFKTNFSTLGYLIRSQLENWYFLKIHWITPITEKQSVKK